MKNSKRLCRMLAYERGGFGIFNGLCNNVDVGFRHFKSAVGKRRTYRPLPDKGIYVPSEKIKRLCRMLAYERGGFGIFNGLCNNVDVGLRHFKSAVGERRTYIPLFKGDTCSLRRNG